MCLYFVDYDTRAYAIKRSQVPFMAVQRNDPGQIVHTRGFFNQTA